MLKKFLILILTIGVLFTSGCEKPKSNVKNSKISNNVSSLKSSQQVDFNSNKTDSNNSNSDVNNTESGNDLFFFNNNDSQANYKGISFL